MKRAEEFIEKWYGICQMTFAVLELSLLLAILWRAH